MDDINHLQGEPQLLDEITSAHAPARQQWPYTKRHLKFVDLFAGLGGFHVGLARLGHECVLAAEINDSLQDIYWKNFGIKPAGDIRGVPDVEVPDHEVLCAGFPCQPFSRAGKKEGSACPSSGRLIDDVIRIAQAKRPKYIMLENVPDILTIANGSFWNRIESSFTELGYDVDYRIYSPRDFGIPQKRRRVFVVASLIGLKHFTWPSPQRKDAELSRILETNPVNTRTIPRDKIIALEKWDEFIRKTREFTSLPILAPEFGATYPFDKTIRTVKDASRYRGQFGSSLANYSTWREIRNHFPSYVRDTNGRASPRLSEAIEYSRQIYARNKRFLDEWKREITSFPNSWLKFEWQGYRDTPSIWRHLIQFRASGIRIIKPDCAPSLVAMSTTQTPIIGTKKRYMTLREAAALQSLESLDHFPSNTSAAYKALGNAVNAHIVSKIAENLLY